MRAVDIIARKRDGFVLSAEEIDFFVQGFTHGDIPDYQAAAWAMAVLLRGMTDRETTDLTMVMVRSGERLDLGEIAPRVVDKHSTGGVGDKTSLVVGPLVAAVGLPVAKMSGRGLGFTGGTLDKLESIPGFRVSLTVEQLLTTVRQVGIALGGQTADLAPADGKLYALRDVTATVPSLPLIASSIMSKKIAGGARALVLDVKVGKGAFMTAPQEARKLAQLMVRIGAGAGMRVTAVLSDMDQPLGLAVGNALEVNEAIETLKGGGPADFREHCFVVATEMLALGGLARGVEEGRAILEGALRSGAALAKFRSWVRAQGGDERVADDPSLLPRTKVIQRVSAPRSAYVDGVHAREVGLAAMGLGAGRERKGQPIDHSVGIVLEVKVGDHVQAGQALFTVHARNEADAAQAAERVLAAHTWSDIPVLSTPPIYEVLRGAAEEGR